MTAPAASAPALLVVDDEAPVLALVPQLFGDDFAVLTARSGEEALATLAAHEVGVVLADQRMPGMLGTELLGRIAAERPDVVRILITAYADADNLLEAINIGHVWQFVTKPWDNRELATLVRRAMETYRLRRENERLMTELAAANDHLEVENRALRSEVGERYRLGRLIGTSAAMQVAYRLLEKAGRSSATVLLLGETGTGKELAGAFIHEHSARRHRRFVPVNCGAMPESLLESELFGHVRGAFTGALRDRRGLFEEAHGGTIFLDEVGEMTPAMQAKVLRVVEDGIIRPVGAAQGAKVDVRVVCATNRDLKAEVETGRFRRDLFYRLNVFPVALPPLRARDGDVPLLAQHFLRLYDTATAKHLRGFTPAALACLRRYAWPGNVRELKNEVERAVALAEPGDAIDTALLSPEITGDATLAAATPGGSLGDRLDRVEQLLILEELRRHGDNRTHTARTLGISVRALQKKIARYGLRDPAAAGGDDPDGDESPTSDV